MQESVQNHITQFFTGLGITLEGVEVVFQGDAEVNVRVQTPDSALLIGMHGKNIESFQHLLGRMLEKSLEKHVHLHLEVNDYMKAKDERLFRFLDTKIAFVTGTGKISRIPNLTSYERKKAHSYISEKNIIGLKTRSDGEGAERVLLLEFTGEIVKKEVVAPQPNQEKRVSLEDLSEDGVGI